MRICCCYYINSLSCCKLLPCCIKCIITSYRIISPYVIFNIIVNCIVFKVTIIINTILFTIFYIVIIFIITIVNVIIFILIIFTIFIVFPLFTAICPSVIVISPFSSAFARLIFLKKAIFLEILRQRISVRIQTVCFLLFCTQRQKTPDFFARGFRFLQQNFCEII